MASILALVLGGMVGSGTGFSMYQLLKSAGTAPNPRARANVGERPMTEPPTHVQRPTPTPTASVVAPTPPARVPTPQVSGAKIEPQPVTIRNRVLQRAYSGFRDIFALGHDDDSSWDAYPQEKVLFEELHAMCNNLVNWGILLQDGVTQFNEEDEDYIEELINQITTHVRENMLNVIHQYDNTTMEVDFDRILQQFMKEINRLRVVLPKLLNVRIQRQYIRA